MADNVEIQGLEFQIQENSAGAVTGLNNLKKALSGLKTVSVGSANNLSKTATGIRELTNALKGLNTGDASQKINRLATALAALGNLSSFRSTTNSIVKLNSALTQLKWTDGDKLASLANGLRPLSELDKAHLTSFINQLGKLPGVINELEKADIDKFTRQMKDLSAAMKPFADEMQKVSNGFSAFPSKIQRIIASTNRYNGTVNKAASGTRAWSEALAGIKLSTVIYASNRIGAIIAEYMYEASEWEGIMYRFGRAFGEEAEENYKWILMFTTAALPIDTHMNCLQLIAHAARCRLFTDDDNIIHIKPFGVTVTGIYSGEWSDNGHLWYSEWDTVDRGNQVGNTYCTLELNRWTLDGQAQVIVPDEDPSGRGYISEAMTGAEGSFTTAPVFTKEFDVSHDLPVVAIRFDTPLNEYPSSVQIKYYRNSTLLDTQTVSEIDSAEVFVSSNLAFDCTKIEVTMYGNLPYRRMRVSKVYYRETDFTLDFSSIAEKSQSISKIDQLKAVTVARYAYTADSEAQKLYEETTTKTQLHVEFSGLAQDIQISVSGGSVVSQAIYARAADLVLSSGTKTVTITGKTLSENSVVVSYPVALEGEVDKEENPLITNDTMCNALADHVKSYLTMRNTYDADYRGNPEMEVGDIIGLQTAYTPEMDALILVDEITFNGSLSGKMKVKGLI